MPKNKPSTLRILFVPLILIAAALLLACDPASRSESNRAAFAARSRGTIKIGVVESPNHPTFRQGVALAVEEINRDGGLLGRELQALNFNDRGNPRDGMKIAHKLADNREVIAVVGHFPSEVAVRVAITYQRQGILFMAPGATDPQLTRYNFPYIFRTIPSNILQARRLADYAAARGYRKMLVFYERDRYGISLGNLFRAEIMKRGIDVAAIRSYEKSAEDDPVGTVAVLLGFEFDAVFWAGGVPLAAKLIRQVRRMGMSAPIIAGDTMHSSALWQIAGEAAEGIVVPTFFDPRSQEPATSGFIDNFRSRHSGQTPGEWGALGYDAVKLLAFTVNKAESAVPRVIAANLRYTRNWQGATGTHSFTRSGDVRDKPIFFNVLRQGRFEPAAE